MPQKTQKKENLPVKVDVDLQNGGTISYANEVIATIAGVAANEIDGIAGMCVSGGFGEILGRNKNITRGVKVEVGSQEAAVDLYIIVEYGQPIQKVAAEVQENVRKALESLTGLHVVRVDVHVQGVSFEKEKKANQKVLEASKNPILAAPAPELPEKKEEKTEEKPVETETPADTEEAPSEPEFDEGVLAEEAKLDEAPKAAADEASEQPDAPAKEEAKPRRKRKPASEKVKDGEEEKPRPPKERLRA